MDLFITQKKKHGFESPLLQCITIVESTQHLASALLTWYFLAHFQSLEATTTS